MRQAAGAVGLLRGSARARYALNAFAGQTLFAVATFAASVITARLFGPTGRGELAAWILVASVGSIMLAGPIPVGLGRAVLAGDRTRLLLAPWVHATAAGVVASAAAVAAVAAGVDPLTAVLFLAVVVPTGLVVIDLLVVFQAAKLPWSYHCARLPAPAVLAIGLGVLWVARERVSLNEAYVLAACGSVCSAVVASLLVRFRLQRPGGGRRSTAGLIEQFTSLARLGRGSYFAMLLDTLLLRADQFVILIAGRAELGLYAVAVSISEVSLYLGYAIGQAAFEDEATLDRVRARALMVKSAVTVGAVSGAVATAGFLLIPYVFGDAFGTSRYALLLLTPGVVARTVAYTGGQIMLAQGRGRAVSRVLAITFAAALPAAALGAWQFGVYGVATAATLAYTLQMVLVVRCFRLPG